MTFQEVQVLRAAVKADPNNEDAPPQLNRHFETTVRQLAAWGLIGYHRIDTKTQTEDCFFVWMLP